MNVTIQIPTALRAYTGGLAAVPVQGETAGAALEGLTRAWPGLARHLRTEDGALRSFVSVYLNDEDIRHLQKEATPLREGDTLIVVPSIAGGADGAAGAPSDSPATSLTNEEIARYSRHLILDEVGMEGQLKLKNAKVLCVGTGGLGSPLLLYLAAAGVGRIGIVDFDVVDASNLQRQIVHGTSTVGQRKVVSAKARILDVNPHVQVDVYEEPFTSENALRIAEPYDVIVDGTDNFPTRYLVNDVSVLLGKPNVYGSIFKFEGQASVFNYAGGPNYRDVYPEPPPPGLVPSCAEGGVLGVLPGIIGTIQATETIKILLGKGTTLSGRLLLFDALEMRFRELKLRKDPHARPIERLIDYDQFCGVPKKAGSKEEHPGAEGGFARLSVREVADRRAAGWSPFVLDVRGESEAAIVRFPWADKLIPHTEVARRLAELPRDREILVHCKLGGRSAQAAAVLAEAGFRVTNLEGGIIAWAKEIEPGMPTY